VARALSIKARKDFWFIDTSEVWLLVTRGKRGSTHSDFFGRGDFHPAQRDADFREKIPHIRSG
jgi:hypothetical protein